MDKNQSASFETRSDTHELAMSLIEINDICKKNELYFWLNYGALLGMVREGRLLPWNNDVEVCCWANDTSKHKIKAVADDLNLAGYTCFYYSSFGTLNIKKSDKVDININLYWIVDEFAVRPHETASKYQGKNFLASLFYWLAVFIFMYPNTFQQVFRSRKLKDLIKISVSRIFSYFRPQTRRKYFDKLIGWSEHWGGVFQQTAIPKRYFSSFTVRKFYGSEMNFPNEPEKLLAFIYGEEWRIPKDNWSFYSETNKANTGIIFVDEKFDYKPSDIF